MTAIASFHRLIPDTLMPMRADRAALGTLPTAALQYCEAITSASAFGWYAFPPTSFHVQWDGTNFLWTHDDADAWFPLRSEHFPGFDAAFDDDAPEDMRGFAPPFLTALPQPGVLQVWTGVMVRTRPGWSLLVRPPANLARSRDYEPYEGIIETDRWFYPLFINLRIIGADRPIFFDRNRPLLQAQPMLRQTYDEAELRTASFVARRTAVPLSFLHGWGMAGASLMGLAFAPASHAAALGPGCMPVFLALLAFVAFRKTLSVQQCVGLAAITTGAIALIATAGTHAGALAVTLGDAMFLTAAVLGAIYFVIVEHHRIPAIACNAVVMTFSGLVVVPAYLAFADSNIPSASMHDLAVQVLFQGVLMSLAYSAVHKAVLLIGGARVSMIMAILPVLTLLAGHSIAGDGVTLGETMAIAMISGGILYGALFRLRRESAQRA